MESVPESSQQQKRKLVTHGLEDQKRVSGRTFLLIWLVALEWLSMVQGAQVVAGMLLLSITCVCLSLEKEAGWWLMICQIPVLGLKP